jgi:hypothetical protein
MSNGHLWGQSIGETLRKRICQKVSKVSLTEASLISHFRILARWNRGKYNKFQIEASLEAMDENIMVMSVGKPTGSFFWTRCDDSTRTKHEINISVRAHNYHQACIIDSTPEHSIIGIIDRDELEVYVGSNVVSTHTLSETKDPYSYNIPCFKNKLYIGT